MKVLLKRKLDLTVTKWSGGSTTELMIYPKDASYKERNFLIRVSRAEVTESPSTFTLLTGFNRVLMPLDSLLTLDIAGEKRDVPPFSSVKFDGGKAVTSLGITSDVGVMYKEGFSIKIVNGENGIYSLANLFTCVYALNDGIRVETDNKAYVLSKGDFLEIEKGEEKLKDLTLSVLNQSSSVLFFIEKV